MCHLTEEWQIDFIQMKRESHYFKNAKLFDKYNPSWIIVHSISLKLKILVWPTIRPVLSCQYEQFPTLRWRQRGSIISQGSTINPLLMTVKDLEPSINDKTDNMSYRYKKRQKKTLVYMYVRHNSTHTLLKLKLYWNWQVKSYNFSQEKYYKGFVSHHRSKWKKKTWYINIRK